MTLIYNCDEEWSVGPCMCRWDEVRSTAVMHTRLKRYKLQASVQAVRACSCSAEPKLFPILHDVVKQMFLSLRFES